MKELIPQFINFLILSSALFFILRKKYKNFFKERSERIEKQIYQLNLDEKKAKDKNDFYMNKIVNLVEDIKNINEDADLKHLKYKEDIKKLMNEKKVQLYADHNNRLHSLHDEIVFNIKSKLYSYLSKNIKDRIRSSDDLSERFSKNMVDEI